MPAHIYMRTGNYNHNLDFLNGRSLFGLWQSQIAKKDPAAAATQKQFKDAWKQADTQLRITDFYLLIANR